MRLNLRLRVLDQLRIWICMCDRRDWAIAAPFHPCCSCSVYRSPQHWSPYPSSGKGYCSAHGFCSAPDPACPLSLSPLDQTHPSRLCCPVVEEIGSFPYSGSARDCPVPGCRCDPTAWGCPCEGSLSLVEEATCSAYQTLPFEAALCVGRISVVTDVFRNLCHPGRSLFLLCLPCC